MRALLVSFAVGLDVLYGLPRVKSPAPPLSRCWNCWEW
jgi:XapX domain-containing protein